MKLTTNSCHSAYRQERGRHFKSLIETQLPTIDRILEQYFAMEIENLTSPNPNVLLGYRLLHRATVKRLSGAHVDIDYVHLTDVLGSGLAAMHTPIHAMTSDS